ncbi:MAG: phosphotriesterase [Cyclobacteriaceae bacterium]|nr:MAG: phosphotriesterase [Cyclobacteriaceae bacterium]
MFSRREFLVAGLGLLFFGGKKQEQFVLTINGKVAASKLGKSLIHEHFLVDFVGADKISSTRWSREAVVKKVLPFLLEASQHGVKSIFDCTPNFLGRDIQLLKMLAEKSGLQIITNTGYYGAGSNKYLPALAFIESAEQLAEHWVDEFENGIDSTTVRPGFIKIGVDAEAPLSELHKKLINAAAITHLKTGLTICSHTGPAKPALEQIEIIKKLGVHPSAFVWVHAQTETDKQQYLVAARSGAWISLDGIGWGDFDNYIDSIVSLKREGLLNRVLISHDAGWYKPDEPAGGEFMGFTNIFTEIIPRLKQNGFTKADLNQLLITNPAEALSVRIRKL